MVTVLESMAPPGEDLFNIDIGVSTLRTSEREHPMVFRLQQSTSSAIVEPFGRVENILFDVILGIRDHSGGPIQEEFVLESLVSTIPSRQVAILNDLRPEDHECFTIRIHVVDVFGRLEFFECNEEGTNFFCEHTICIEDDDGKNFTCNS